MTYSGQEGVLEERDITEKEEECETRKHRWWDPPIPRSRCGGEGVVLEDRESTGPGGEEITPLHAD